MRYLRAALLAVGALAFAGHVCVLPDTTETRTMAPAGEHDGHADGLHAGACDALGAQPAPAPTVFAAPASVRVTAVRLAETRVADIPAPPAYRPPRFLLHAALLI
jgi:hypothetical protein